MSDESPHEPAVHHLPSWEQVTAGVYLSVGGRFKISRRGPGKWVLTDNETGKRMQFALLYDAQSRAEWVLNNKK